MRTRYKQIVWSIFQTFFTAGAFFLNRQTLLEKGAILLDRKELMEKGMELMGIAGLPLVTVALTAIALFFFYSIELFVPKLEQAKEAFHLRAGYVLLAALFAFFMVFGESYMCGDSWQLVFGSWQLIGMSLFMGVGFFLLFRRLFLLVELFWERRQTKTAGQKEAKTSPWKKVLGFYDRHPFLGSLAAMLLCWAIYIVAFYPAILSPDPSFQIKQYFNEHTKYADYVVLFDENVKMTNHHPVAHSVLLGVSIEAGRLFGSDNLGLFFYSLFQTLVLSGTLSYTVYYMKKLGLGLKLRLVALCIYCFVPMFPFYAMSAVKDVLFGAWMILYGLLLFDLIRNRQKKLTGKRAVLLLLLLFLLTIFRNNGFHVILLSFPFLFLVMKGNRKRLLLISLGFLVLYGGYFKALLPGLHITEGSVREMLSLPFQQTARYVRDHEENLTEKDKEIIDRILGYEDLADRYDPELADPVKNNYNKYATGEDLQAYFGVWFQGLLKHPDTYVEATMNNVYGFFYPNKTKWYIYSKYDDRITENGLVDYHYNGLEGLRTGLTKYGAAFPYVPFVGLLSNIGFNTWLLLYMAVWMFDKRRRHYFVALMPYLATVLICVASPANTYFRYALPYIFAMPMLVSFMLGVQQECRKGTLSREQTFVQKRDREEKDYEKT